MQNTPPISVITAVHNGLPYLQQTVESILRQTFPDFEYLIVDDGSTDGTTEYLESISDERVRTIRCSKIGLVAARNTLVHEARGAYLANIDADDLAHPERLAKQIDWLRNHPDCVVLGTQADLIDVNGQPLGERSFPISDAAIRFQMIFGCPFLHPSTTYSRQATLRCGGFRKEFNYTEDYELWTRLAECGTMANLTEKLTSYRIHPESITTNYSATHTEHACQLVGNYLDTLGIKHNHSHADLYRFLQNGSCEETDMRRLVDLFEDIIIFFAKRYTPHEEIASLQRSLRTRLRWICLENSQESLRNPLQCFRWLMLAGQFDPDSGKIHQILKRYLAKHSS